MLARCASAVLLVGAFASGCGSDGATTPRSDASVSAVELACPDQLARDSAGRTESDDDATTLPRIAVPDQAWMCSYWQTGEYGSDAGYVWELQAEPVEIVGDDLAELGRLLPTAFELPTWESEDGTTIVCPANLGPRVVVVMRSGDVTTGIAYDQFGCADVRLTDDLAGVVIGTSGRSDLVAGNLRATSSYSRFVWRIAAA